MSDEYDLKITGGLVVDGTGSPGRRADVGIRDGKITAVGDAKGSTAATIEADGRVVAPGFVDIHTHYDAQVMWDRMLSVSPWHGVTTVVVGNCGFGVAPTRPQHRDLIMRTLEKVEGMSLQALEAGLGEEWPFETFPQYLDVVENLGTAINFGVLIGHTPLRMFVMGEESTERAATDDEISTMREIVREALGAGAVGLATSKAPTHVGYGGRPVPSRVAEIKEIQALAAVLGETGKGMMQATLGPELLFNEFATIAADTGRTISWTALLAGLMGPGSHRPFLKQSIELLERGLPIVPQVSCRPLVFEFQFKEPFVFESMPIFQPVSAADFDGKVRIYRDPEFRQRFKEKGESSGVFRARWDRTVISDCPSDRSLEERSVAAVAAQRGVDPVDLALDLALDSNLEARFRVALLNDDEDEVAELLQDSHTVLGLSDAGAHASQLCDACFSTHLLGHWVREKEVLSLEGAVRMLTSRPAEVFGLTDRGRLAEGVPADVVVFDPETVGAGKLRRVHDLPAKADRLVSDASGIDAVVVNGTLIRQGGRDVVDADGPLPGRLLRNGSAR